MILFIESLIDSHLFLALVKNDKVIISRKILGGSTTENFIRSISQFLKITGYSVADLKKIVVATYPAGFSSTRLAVTIVNALAWSLNIPIGSVTSGSFLDKVISGLNNINWSKIVKPVYKYPAVR